MPHECTDCGRTFPDGSKEMLSGCPTCGGNTFQFRPSGDGSETSDSSTAGDESPPDPPTSGNDGPVNRATTTVREWVSGDSGDGSPPSEDDFESTEDFEWPNPDDADTSGVGKGPEARRRQSVGTDDRRSDDDVDPGDADPESPNDTDTTSAGSGIQSDESIGAGGSSSDEDAAQRSARSDVVSTDEIPDDTSSTAPDDIGDVDAASVADAGGDATVADTPDEDRPDIDELREELNDQFESIKIVEPGQYELNLMELYNREEYIISLKEDGRYVIEVPETWRNEE